MKSSFKKNESQKTKEDIFKTFFGHPEFDAIFNNSLKKGMLFLIEEDSPTNIYISFLRYFIGSNFYLDQTSFIYESGIEKWGSIIPYKSDTKINNEENIKAETAKIAWRYEEMNIKSNPLIINNDIPKLDLSKSVEDKIKIDKLIIQKETNNFSSLKELFIDIHDSLQNNLKNPNDTATRKILIHNLFSDFNRIKYTNNELAKFFTSLKILIKSSFSLLVLTIPSNIDNLLKSYAIQNFDIAIKIEGILGNKNFDDFQGILHILKLPLINSLNTIQVDTLSWGIKTISKRKLQIEKLYPSIEKESQKEENKEDNKICSSKPGGKQDLTF